MTLFRLFGRFKGTSHHSDTPSEPSFVPAAPSPSSHLPHPVHLCSLLPHQAHQPLSLASKAHMSPDSHHLLLHQVHQFLSSSIATPVKSIATLASHLHHHLPFSHSPLTSVSHTHTHSIFSSACDSITTPSRTPWASLRTEPLIPRRRNGT